MERMRRVNALLKRELGGIFERDICPHFDCLITVTDVATSPDLRHARVYISVYGSDDQRQNVIRAALDRRKDMQRRIASNVTLKYTPKLDFQIDDTAEKADRVSQLLDELTREDSPDADA